MIPADVAFALLINRTTDYYKAHQPLYMTYTERTQMSAPSMGRSQNINRSVSVRVADDLAVMKDLPNGGERTGQAFPIIAEWDPFSVFSLGWFANLKRVDVDLKRGEPIVLPTPEPDPTVNMVVPYNSYWAARYAPDSSDDALHLLIDPSPRASGSFYPAEVVEDPQTQLPSRIVMKISGNDTTIALDFKVIDGYWVIVHGVWSSTQHALVYTAKVVFDTSFDDITFSQAAPDPRLAGTPTPSPEPSPT